MATGEIPNVLSGPGAGLEDPSNHPSGSVSGNALANEPDPNNTVLDPTTSATSSETPAAGMMARKPHQSTIDYRVRVLESRIAGLETTAIANGRAEALTSTIAGLETTVVAKERADALALTIAGLETTVIAKERADALALTIAGLETTAVAKERADALALTIAGLETTVVAKERADALALTIAGLETTVIANGRAGALASTIAGLETTEIANGRASTLATTIEGLETKVGAAKRITDLETKINAVPATSTDVGKVQEDLSNLQKAFGVLKGQFEEHRQKFGSGISGLPPLPQGVCERLTGVQKEEIEWWTKKRVLPSADKKEEEALDAIKNASAGLKRGDDNQFTKLEGVKNCSIKWVTADAGDDADWRIALSRTSSIDASEIICPTGQTIIGIALGPWLGDLEGRPPPNGSISLHTHMSIKLLCKAKDGKTSLYGNSQPKTSQTPMEGKENPGLEDSWSKAHRDDFVPFPSSTLNKLYCDGRASTYERFVSNIVNDGSVGAKEIASLRFYNYNPKGLGSEGSMFTCLPTFQDAQRPCIAPTAEKIAELYQNGLDLKGVDFFRKIGNFTPQKLTSQGIDRLYYNTRIVRYNEDEQDWVVTGVQMYLKGKDTLALNVRFSKPPLL